MEKSLKTNIFPERSPVKVDCSVDNHSKSLFSKTNENWPLSEKDEKIKLLPKICLHSALLYT